MVLFELFYLNLLNFCSFISCNLLLVIVNPHAIPVDIGLTIKPIPVRNNMIEPNVVAKITNVSNVFNHEVNIF